MDSFVSLQALGRVWRMLVVMGFAFVLLLDCQPAKALEPGAGAAFNPSPASTQIPDEISVVAPQGALALRVAYLPSAAERARAAELAQQHNGLALYEFPGNINAFRSDLVLQGKGNIQGEWSTSKDLRMKFFYENDFASQGGHTKSTVQTEYTPNDKLRMQLAYDFESAYVKALAQGGGAVAGHTNLSYQLDYSPSASSHLRALWKSFAAEAVQGKAGSESETTQVDYEQKFSVGLVRLGQTFTTSTTGGQKTQASTSSMHAELGTGRPYSLVADWMDKQNGQSGQTLTTVTGKMAFSPALNLAFNFADRQATGQADSARTDIAMTANLGSKNMPLQLTGRSIMLAQGNTEAQAQELALQGSLNKSGVALKVAGNLRGQQGTLDGKGAGNSQKIEIEAKTNTMKLAGGTETLVPDKGTVIEKDHLEAQVAVTSSTEAFWQNRTQSGDIDTENEKIGVSQKMGDAQISASHEAFQTGTDGQQWDTMQLLVRSHPKLPAWVNPLEGAGLLDTAKYGYRMTPGWGATAPGLEIGWRQRAGMANDNGSLRVVYRGMLGGLHLRAGQETNPWTGGNGTEQLSMGQRSFVEMGVPFSKNLATICRLSQTDIANQQSDGFFLSLRSVLSRYDKLELFYANEPTWQPQAPNVDPTAPSYGVAFSHSAGEQDFLTLKAAVNPPVAANNNNKPQDNWRMDIALSKPF
jgi:hypothetical protein